MDALGLWQKMKFFFSLLFGFEEITCVCCLYSNVLLFCYKSSAIRMLIDCARVLSGTFKTVVCMHFTVVYFLLLAY